MKHQCAMFRDRAKRRSTARSSTRRASGSNAFTAQHCLSAGQVVVDVEVYASFDRLEQGNENAMKEYYQQCVQAWCCTRRWCSAR